MARNENASYESIDNKRSPINGISTLDLAYYSFASLEEFVTATNGTEIATKRGYSFQFRDTTGWCPIGTANYWYRCLLVKYQNPVGSTSDIQGTVLLSTFNTTEVLILGEISGTSSFSVIWTFLKDYRYMRTLTNTTSTLNGRFIGFPNGSSAIAAHASGNLTTQYRVQLNNDGNLCRYTSTDSGSNFTYKCKFVTDADVSAYGNVFGTLHSNITNGSIRVTYNTYTKLAVLTMAVYVGTAITSSSNIVLASGLPKSVLNYDFIAVKNGTESLRGAILTDGKLYGYTQSISTGWWSAGFSYVYSSL